MLIHKAVALALCVLFLAGTTASAATAPPEFAGTWLGSLEYRDFGNDARVKLPTLLTVGRSDGALLFFFTFDDGAGKVVRDRDVYRIESVDGFGDAGASGAFVATGSGTENGRPVDVRETVSLTASTLTLLRETRPQGSNAEYSFRHRYRFSRISPTPGGAA